MSAERSWVGVRGTGRYLQLLGMIGWVSGELRQSMALLGTRIEGKTGQLLSFTLPYEVRHLFIFFV